jgi:broad specificity phosphatase PhoE
MLPVIYLARHGETAWSLSGQHTGLTDLPLTKDGEEAARRLGDRLKALGVTKVFTSPLQRAARTCELAGFGNVAQIDPDLVEWNYGKYEGLRTSEIRQTRPGWELFRDGCPEGETLNQIGTASFSVLSYERSLGEPVVVLGNETRHLRA